MTTQAFTNHCYVVQQQDAHWAFLTCRETLMFAAELYLGKPAAEVAGQVDALIGTMGLDSCKNTRCGNQFMQGLSGGQKRRLSIAIALIKQPKLIFLDEPTSGLDAAAAANIMVAIKDLAASSNLIIVATIHQPSSKVYKNFDQVMLLSGGREAYCGTAIDAADYFSSLGWPMNENTNPAEFFLDLVNADFIPQSEVNKILIAWSVKRDLVNKHFEIIEPESTIIGDGTGINRSMCHESFVMFYRHALLSARDPVFYIGRAMIFLVANVYFALVYWEARQLEQDQVFNRMYLCIWYIGVAANMGVVAVFALNAEYKSVHKEIKNGMVKPESYLFAKSLLEIPVMFIFAIFALTIPAYAISDFYLPHYFSNVFVWAVSIYAWESLAQALSVAFENPLLGMMQFMGCWFSGFLFCGVFIPRDDIHWPFKLFYYTFPLKNALRSMVYVEFIDNTFPECTTSDVLCFGADGKTILDSVGNIYELFSSKDTYGEDIACLLAIAFVCKAVYFAILIKKSRSTSRFDGPLDPASIS